MDKYEGVNRPETVCVEKRYETIMRHEFASLKGQAIAGKEERKASDGLSDSDNSKHPLFRNYKHIFTIIRYGVCLLILAVCLIGKFTDFKPAVQTSEYIKKELNRDIIKEVADSTGWLKENKRLEELIMPEQLNVNEEES